MDIKFQSYHHDFNSKSQNKVGYKSPGKELAEIKKNKKIKYDKMANYCFDIMEEKRFKMKKKQNITGSQFYSRSRRPDIYEIQKSVPDIARMYFHSPYTNFELRKREKEKEAEENQFFEDPNVNKNLEDNDVKKSDKLANLPNINLNKSSINRSSIGRQGSIISNIGLLIQNSNNKDLKVYSTVKVNKIFSGYFRNRDIDSEEIKEINEIMYAKKLREQEYQKQGKTFNITSEKFRPKILDPKKMYNVKSKQFIIRGIANSLAPCKIPADYIERRKLYNNVFQNQKLMKIYSTVPRRDKPGGVKINDVTDIIVKATEDQLERVLLLFHYICNNIKYDMYYDFTDFNAIFNKKNLEIDKMNKTVSGKQQMKSEIKSSLGMTGFDFRSQEQNNFSREYAYQELDKIISLEHIWRVGRTFFSGFVTLFIEMLKMVNINAENIVRIFGFYKPTMSFELKKVMKLDIQNAVPNHEWLRINILDNWYLIDPSFGRGYFNSEGFFVEEFNLYYLLTPPNFLIDSHYPIEESNQLLQKPIKPGEFVNMQPVKYKDFYDAVFKFGFIPIQPYLPYLLMKPKSVGTALFELQYPIKLEMLNFENVKMPNEKYVSYVRSGNSYSVSISGLELLGVYTLIINGALDNKNLSNFIEVARISVIVSTED